MQLRKVNAIIRTYVLEEVEERLKKMRVKGLTVTHVKGYGECHDFLAHNWQVRHARIEIFAEKARAEEIAQAIIETAHSGVEGDGIVVILPVEKMFRIRTKAEAQPDEI